MFKSLSDIRYLAIVNSNSKFHHFFDISIDIGDWNEKKKIFLIVQKCGRGSFAWLKGVRVGVAKTFLLNDKNMQG